ncbi:MAG: RNA polymerase sigma factor, partial [Acidimicrobiia bacterium]
MAGGGLGECGDSGLVHQAQAGSTEAFAELYRRHYPAVVASCRRQGTADAEEVAQVAFLRAFERIDRCQGEARFGAWIQVIARHVSVDVARARTRDLARPAVAVLPGTSADWPEEHALRQERVETLRSVMGRLPRRQREVLYARDVEGRRPPEIAAAFGLSLGAVDSLLLRARRAAAAWLPDHGRRERHGPDGVDGGGGRGRRGGGLRPRPAGPRREPRVRCGPGGGVEARRTGRRPARWTGPDGRRRRGRG